MLAASIKSLEDILANVDKAMAQARCRATLERLDWLDDSEEMKATIQDATEEMLEGTLRNNRGTVRCLLHKDPLYFPSLLFLFRNSSAT